MSSDDGGVDGGGRLLGVGERLKDPPMFSTEVAKDDEEDDGDGEDQGDDDDEVEGDQGEEEEDGQFHWFR